MNDHSAKLDRLVSDAMEQHGPGLLRYAARLTADRERGRDVVQETFAALCREPADSLDGHLVEWLYTVCRRKALDVRRKESRMMLLDQEIAPPTESSPELGPERRAEAKDSAEAAMRALAQLDPRAQEIARLKFQNGLTYKQIAGVLGIGEGNVGFILSTALRSVRLALGAGDSDRVNERKMP